MKDEVVTTWVKPVPVPEVKFTKWTKAGEMRDRVYLRLNENRKEPFANSKDHAA